jgi:hypothetical protein
LSLSLVRRRLTGLRGPSGLTLASISLMLFLGNVVFGSVGLRGTDQYWYAGDLWMSRITGQAVTNAIYPTATGLSANASTSGLPIRIHNLPATFLASFVHQAGASDYLAWVYVNLLIALFIAVGMYFVARSQGYSAAYIAPVFFLSFPLTLWLSINALADMSLALGSCLIMLGATVVSKTVHGEGRKVSIGLLIIALGSLLMFYTRDNYMLLFPAFVLFTFWVCRSHRERWLWAAPILGITAFLAALKHVLLPQYPVAGLMSQLMVGTPSGGEAMTQYYRLDAVPFSPSEFITKAMIGLRDALLPQGASELITESSIIVIVIVALLVFRKDDSTRVLGFWMAVVGVIYLITAAGFASQNRYIFTLVPFVAVFGAGLWDRIISGNATPRVLANGLRLGAVGFLIVCVSGSFLMARTYRMEATTEVAQTSRLITGLAGEPSGSVLAVAQTSMLLPLTYAAVPRPVLAMNPRINSSAEAALLIKTWKVRVLVGANDTDLQYFLSAVDSAYGGRAKLITQPSLETPGGTINMWLIETGSTN